VPRLKKELRCNRRSRLVERAAPDEPHARPAVFAEDRHLAARAPVDALSAAVARDANSLRVSREQLDLIGVDQEG
jgi:hypothetical protein